MVKYNSEHLYQQFYNSWKVKMLRWHSKSDYGFCSWIFLPGHDSAGFPAPTCTQDCTHSS